LRALVAVVLVGNGLGAVMGLMSLGTVIDFGWAAQLLGDLGSAACPCSDRCACTCASK
jgi:hypothetical protein